MYTSCSSYCGSFPSSQCHRLRRCVPPRVVLKERSNCLFDPPSTRSRASVDSVNRTGSRPALNPSLGFVGSSICHSRSPFRLLPSISSSIHLNPSKQCLAVLEVLICSAMKTKTGCIQSWTRNPSHSRPSRCRRRNAHGLAITFRDMRSHLPLRSQKSHQLLQSHL